MEVRFTDSSAGMYSNAADVPPFHSEAFPHVVSTPASSDAPATEDIRGLLAEQLTVLARQMQALTDHVGRIQRERERSSSRPRPRASRSPSSSRRFSTCWYHFKFGGKAEKCVKPCDFAGQSVEATDGCLNSGRLLSRTVVRGRNF